jgi:hypothetical protein
VHGQYKGNDCKIHQTMKQIFVVCIFWLVNVVANTTETYGIVNGSTPSSRITRSTSSVHVIANTIDADDTNTSDIYTTMTFATTAPSGEVTSGTNSSDHRNTYTTDVTITIANPSGAIAKTDTLRGEIADVTTSNEATTTQYQMTTPVPTDGTYSITWFVSFGGIAIVMYMICGVFLLTTQRKQDRDKANRVSSENDIISAKPQPEYLTNTLSQRSTEYSVIPDDISSSENFTTKDRGGNVYTLPPPCGTTNTLNEDSTEHTTVPIRSAFTILIDDGAKLKSIMNV